MAQIIRILLAPFIRASLTLRSNSRHAKWVIIGHYKAGRKEMTNQLILYLRIETGSNSGPSGSVLALSS